MFGRPEAAAAGKLFVVVTGDGKTVESISPMFDAVGQRTFVVSEEPRAANLVKLSGNFLIASVIESLGEAMALVGKAGVDKQEYLEILTSTLFGAPVYKTYGGMVAREEFEPGGFAATLGLKDVRLVLAAGESLAVPLPIASLLRDRFLTLLANGGADLDWAASVRCRPGRPAARTPPSAGKRQQKLTNWKRVVRPASPSPLRVGPRHRRQVRASPTYPVRGAARVRRRR